MTVVKNKMAAQMETVISVYKSLAKIPSLAGACLNKAGNRVGSKWSVRNLDKGKSTKYMYNYNLDDKFKVVSKSDFAIDASNELLSSVSPSEKYRAVIRDDKDSKDVKKQYLEIWQANSLAHCVDLNVLDIHGDVYADGEFGCLSWSPEEDKLLYVAEQKLPKSEPYITRKTAKDTIVTKGEEYKYKQDWGEQLVGKHLSVIVVFQLQDESFTILDGLPESWCPGQVIFAPNGKGVVGVGWETEPRRLGLIFCTNRPGYVFYLGLDGNLTKISSEGWSVRSPRFNISGSRLVWLQRPSGGPHHAAHQIVNVSWPLDHPIKPSILVDIVPRSIEISEGRTFTGMYGLSLPKHCFTNDDQSLVFSTPQETEVRSYVLQLESQVLTDISSRTVAGSTSVLDVRNDVVVASRSNMTTPAQIIICRIGRGGAAACWQVISEPFDVSATRDTVVEYINVDTQDDHIVNSFPVIYMGPHNPEDKVPLIVWPHGGPHSGFVNAYSLEAALFRALGFASLQINYRGSTGQGQASVDLLPGRAGSADVLDCKLATEAICARYPVHKDKICLFGGSHGGFLVTHLSGQYSDMFAAVVTRNPVIDVASMINSTDIADCVGCILIGHLNMHVPLRIILACVGFASIRVNYRGSTGQGNAAIFDLLGNVGTYDVQDCLLALAAVRERDERLKRSAVLLYGASFGGFTAAHLAGKVPELFTAVVLKNPLIDLAVKGHYADNSEGCAVEAGFEFTEQGPVSEEHLLAMRRCSPLAHVHKVKAPTAVMLGAIDKRVPYYQGLEYHRRLKANGCKTRVYMYEDNHSLSSLPAEMDNLINSALWFLQHIK